MGGKGGGNETHGFDGIFGQIIFYIFIDIGATANGEGSGTNAADFNAEFFEEKTKILNHVIRRCTDDGGLARGERCGHKNVFGDSVATFGEDNITVSVLL